MRLRYPGLKVRICRSRMRKLVAVWIYGVTQSTKHYKARRQEVDPGDIIEAMTDASTPFREELMITSNCHFGLFALIFGLSRNRS